MQNKNSAQATIEHLVVWSMIVTVVVWGLLVYFKPAIRTAIDKLLIVLGREVETWEE